MERGERLYLDLLKKALINELGAENELRLNYAWQCAKAGKVPELQTLIHAARNFPERYEHILRARRNGVMLERSEPDIYGFSDTLIGQQRLDQLEDAILAVLAEDIPGDVVECGVWRGGASIFARGVLASQGATDRKVWLADSFAGLPPPTHAIDSDMSMLTTLAVPLDQVKERFARYGLLDENVRFVPGWFHESLPSAPIEQIAVLRADGDIFTSTIAILTALYPKLSPGGFVIIDDYGALPDCQAAVHGYRTRHDISDPIVPIDLFGIYWRKSAA